MTESEKTQSKDALALSRILTFAVGTLPVSALGVVLFVYLPPYLASHLGVPLTAIGISWAAVRILDFGVDPALGFAMDKTRTQFGRYRAWMMLGAPILMLGTFMLFMAAKGITGYYVFFWLFVLYFGFSILFLAHSAWAATLATEYHQRSRVFGIIAAVGVVAAVLALLVKNLAHYRGLTDAQGVQAMGWFIILMAPVAVGITTWRTPEHVAFEVKTGRFELWECLALLKRTDLIRLLLAQMATTLGPGWMSALYLFFFVAARGYTSQQANSLLIVYILAGVLGALATGRVATKLGKHRTYMLTTAAYSLGLCIVMAIPKGSIIGALPIMFWCGFMASGFNLMISAMMADVGDEIRLEQGKERISLLYAMLSLASKAAAALAIALSYPLLSRVIGYNPVEGAVNTHQAIVGLEWAFLAGPIFFVMMGGACVYGWRLDAARHAAVRAALEARDAKLEESLVPQGVTLGPPVAVLAAEREQNAAE